MKFVLNVVITMTKFGSQLTGSLQIARAHIDTFGKLLGSFAQIGGAIPSLMAYRATFKKHPTLATVLEDYYSDILRFHHEALEVFNRGSELKFETQLIAS